MWKCSSLSANSICSEDGIIDHRNDSALVVVETTQPSGFGAVTTLGKAYNDASLPRHEARAIEAPILKGEDWGIGRWEACYLDLFLVWAGRVVPIKITPVILDQEFTIIV